MEYEYSKEDLNKIKEIMKAGDELGLMRKDIAKELNEAGLLYRGQEWRAVTVCSFGLRRNWIKRRVYMKGMKKRKPRAYKKRQTVVQNPQTLASAVPSEKDFLLFAINSTKLSQSTKLLVVQELI